MRNPLLAIAAATMAITAIPAVSTPAYAKEQRRYHTTDNGVRYWRGNDGQYYCKRSNGTTGLLVGAAAGALAGRAIDSHGSRATGTILGAAAGALLGREVQRSQSQARCR